MKLVDQVKFYSKIAGISLTKLAEAVDMSRPGLSAALRNSTLKISTLKKIASVIDVPSYVFLEDEAEQERQLSDFKTIERIIIKGGIVNMEKYIQNIMPTNDNIFEIIKSIYESIPLVTRAKFKQKYQDNYADLEISDNKRRIEYNTMLFAINNLEEPKDILNNALDQIIDYLVEEIAIDKDINYLISQGFATPTSIGFDADTAVLITFNFGTDTYEKVKEALDKSDY